MTAWLKLHITQLLIGLGLVALPVFYFVYTGVSWKPLNPHDHLIQNGLAYIFLVIFSYVNHTVLVPQLFLAKRYRQYAIVVISCVLATVYLPYRIEQWAFFKPPRQNTVQAWMRQIFVEEMMLAPPSFEAKPDQQPPFDERPRSTEKPHFNEGPRFRRMGDSLPLVLPVKLAIFFLLGSVSTLLSISVQTASRLRQVENDQLQAELRQLKAQIQPHFLFNTLNSVYALAIRNDARTADTVVKLSEFMRYNIRDAHRDKVSLNHEINYIANYIDLQKARLRDAVRVDYQQEGATNHLQIAPLLLFTFIENAFKYGVNPEEDSLIRIHITILETQLYMNVTNNKVQVSHLDESTGIGLQNARERLRLLYPNTHELVIDDTPTQFQITLRITL